ncbi:hypothetical protein [uncultured Pseudomonas sp.]|uniref:hypothetical protein n=1 Tax=uncultured Pseudomonas sp. TaxID=114707 RepID=UPI0025DB5618|nr:hypothetical protein [uncultured Pseudomonas sp.]
MPLTPALACLALCLPVAALALGKSAPTDLGSGTVNPYRERKAQRYLRLRQLMAQAHSRKVIA